MLAFPLIAFSGNINPLNDVYDRLVEEFSFGNYDEVISMYETDLKKRLLTEIKDSSRYYYYALVVNAVFISDDLNEANEILNMLPDDFQDTPSFRHYVKGLDYESRGNILQALEEFRKANGIFDSLDHIYRLSKLTTTPLRPTSKPTSTLKPTLSPTTAQTLSKILIPYSAYPNKLSLICYPITTSGTIQTYSRKYYAADGWITANSQCTIIDVQYDGYCSVRYDVQSGIKIQYAHLSDFFIDMPFAVGRITSKTDAYRHSTGNETIGFVDTRDTTVWICGNQNGRTQIICSVTGSNNYKLGWINPNFMVVKNE
ncbi:hypothetical protein AGMMS49992_18120 [Clostridia bacterium]|nr:hypothetical protein AGMMS49992_18120 [Clostridia bacterium]